MIGNRKDDRRLQVDYGALFREWPEIKDGQNFLTEKFKSVPGFKPGRLRQNVVAPALAPPLLPTNWCRSPQGRLQKPGWSLNFESP